MSKRQDRRVKRRTLRALPSMANDPIARGTGVVIVSFDMAIEPDAPCHYCSALATTRDHIVPKAMRGTDAWWNLVPACEPCNRKKSGDAPSCRCAYCTRAVFLFELGHMRPKKSPRLHYVEPNQQKTPRKPKRPTRAIGTGGDPILKVKAAKLQDEEIYTAPAWKNVPPNPSIEYPGGTR